MGHRHRHKLDANPGVDGFLTEIRPEPVVIVGAGSFLGDLIHLVREHPEFSIIGILDPSPTLRGQFVEDIPILGWLGDIPAHIRNAVIANPAHSKAFDRESVFRILHMRGIRMPILRAGSCQCANDVELKAGTMLLPGCTVKSGVRLGLNVLLGNNCRIETGVALADHTTIMPDTNLNLIVGEKQKANPASRVEAALATANESIQNTMRRMNESSLEIILVVNENGILLGTVTDGDIRRGILAGIDVEQPASMIMNPNPITVSIGTSGVEMIRIMRSRSIRHLPVVDGANRPIGLERMETLFDNMAGSNAVVMAGGMGTRLKPITEKIPKPLIPVAGRPILDHIMESLECEGIERVVLSLNYLGCQIRDHVGNGSRYRTRVDYLTEKKRLGTAGALSLLRPRPRKPFLVMNGDLITGLSFSKLFQFQREHDYAMTVCVRRHNMQVPYGVVDIEDGQVTGIREKPMYRFFVNAGIYVLAPACLGCLPENKYFDMTDLIHMMVERGERVGVFPIIEYWRDVGTHADLAAAAAEQNTPEMGDDKEELAARQTGVTA
jgi:NDP-sugar pyrophosphorylase family protein